MFLWSSVPGSLLSSGCGFLLSQCLSFLFQFDGFCCVYFVPRQAVRDSFFVSSVGWPGIYSLSLMSGTKHHLSESTGADTDSNAKVSDPTAFTLQEV